MNATSSTVGRCVCVRQAKAAWLTIALLIATQSCLSGLCAQEPTSRQEVFVHYMPWYESKAVSGHWGWHWTMNHFDPEQMTNGQRQIASHDYPLIGPYDSSDPDVLACQVQQMKLAGIDGVVIDWYGIKDFRDYKTLHRNTQLIINHVKRAGMKFLICYEDQTVKHMIAAKALSDTTDVQHGIQVMQWLQQHWFDDDLYAKIDGHPVLMVFGPQHFQKAAWQKMLSSVSPRPLLFALPHLREASGADASFGWPPVTGGSEIAPEKWQSYLERLYDTDQSTPSIGIAFPGFRDIYAQAGVGESHGYIDDRNGKTFADTLRSAASSNTPLIQIATWNDYGEGTMIEPTKGHGYQYLEAVLEFTGNDQVSKQDLRLPEKIYNLKKRFGNNEGVMKTVEAAGSSLLRGDCEQARQLIRKVSE